MSTIFLHGGGDDPAWRAETFGRFAEATQAWPDRPVALIIEHEDDAEYDNEVEALAIIFKVIGVPAARLRPLRVYSNEPLTRTRIEQLRPAGIFVDGGNTPSYRAALCRDTDWVAYLRETGIPYCGTSAGAAIASEQAIIGGYMASRGGIARPMLYMGAGEGLTELAIEPGLGLVSFPLDVHASQWGTLLRLIHAVDLGLVASGWALDENTLLEVSDSGMRLYGKGHAYHVRASADGGAGVTIYAADWSEASSDPTRPPVHL